MVQAYLIVTELKMLNYAVHGHEQAKPSGIIYVIKRGFGQALHVR